MRLSQMLFVTLREDPAEAEIPSHKLLLRAGYIRRIGSGVYAYLPLMWRVLKKVTQIVREEMDATGAQECLLPQIQPAELWQESGRWDTYKAEGILFNLKDRQGRELGLGPTHEEVITAVARDMIRSYRQLPLHLYQVQTKFRDEIRPRFGLMRGREFIMKDGYSFHSDVESLKETYGQMYQAYTNILRRSGLTFRAVEADSGAIGGSGSHEFMVLADAGEDEVLYTEDGKYAANVEKATALPPDAVSSDFTKFQKQVTPGIDTIEKLCNFLNCSPTQVIKNVLYQVKYDNDWLVLVLVSIRGDQEVNEVKLQNALTNLASNYSARSVLTLSIIGTEVQAELFCKLIPLGYVSPGFNEDYIKAPPRISRQELEEVLSLPHSLYQKVLEKLLLTTSDQSFAAIDIRLAVEAVLQQNPLVISLGNTRDKLLVDEKKYFHHKALHLVDKTVVSLVNFITGSNELDSHCVGANWGQQFILPESSKQIDIRKAGAGDRAQHDPTQLLKTARGIEIGHIFQLGTKYSTPTQPTLRFKGARGATFTTEQGEESPLVMGCYGVGVSRLAQAAVEQSHDKDGIIWPVAIAPYHAIVVIPNIKEATQVEAAEQIYQDLNAAGIETLLDDRDERPGVKFKDSELIGIPYRVVTGRSLAQGKVEVVKRADKTSVEIPIAELVSTLKGWIAEALK